MDAISAWSTGPMTGGLSPVADTGPFSLAAARGQDGQSLTDQIQSIADEGRIEDFLSQTTDAITLAQRSPVFAQELDPLLADIRTALGEISTRGLSRVERDAVATTIEFLDEHLAAAEQPGGPDGPDGPDAPDPVAEVPGGGLQAHEDVGGHLIERHVGKSEQWLINRVDRENISAASSFRDLPEAEHFVAATIVEHQDRVDAWVDGEGGRRLVIDATFDASTGISVSRGQNDAVDVFSVRLVLERSSELDIGYRIVTGYPNKP